MVRALGAHTWNANFEICCSGQTDSIVAEYSASNSGVPSGSQPRFQGNIVKVSLMLEGILSIFATVPLTFSLASVCTENVGGGELDTFRKLVCQFTRTGVNTLPNMFLKRN
jgi:hypothetical protein